MDNIEFEPECKSRGMETGLHSRGEASVALEREFTRMVKEHRTWIWRVSLNTCNNQVRRKKRDVETVPLTIDIDLYNDDDTKSRQIQMLHDRISRLEPFDRAIILLWLENMTYEDIAGIMGISLANVTTRLFRIKEQLKQMSNA